MIYDDDDREDNTDAAAADDDDDDLLQSSQCQPLSLNAVLWRREADQHQVHRHN